MAEGVLRLSGADFSVSVSGVAGPDGGTREKPVGTVWIAWADQRDGTVKVDTSKNQFAGDREAVRVRTVVCALQGMRERLRSHG
jgi:nicotinamide-nucleotide amidase